MLHKAWSSIEEVPYCFWRSSIKFQGHTALKIIKFHPNWVFPDCNSSLNSPMAMKCCTKLETAKERCPIVFQGHPSNFKVTRYKTSQILTQIGHFPTVGRSQLSNPSDLPCSPNNSRKTPHTSLVNYGWGSGCFSCIHSLLWDFILSYFVQYSVIFDRDMLKVFGIPTNHNKQFWSNYATWRHRTWSTFIQAIIFAWRHQAITWNIVD